jgi:hypothetical protein
MDTSDNTVIFDKSEMTNGNNTSKVIKRISNDFVSLSDKDESMAAGSNPFKHSMNHNRILKTLDSIPVYIPQMPLTNVHSTANK